MIGDGHQPRSRVLCTHCKDSGFPIKGGMTIPNIGSLDLDRGTYKKTFSFSEFFQTCFFFQQCEKIDAVWLLAGVLQDFIENLEIPPSSPPAIQ